MVSVEDVEKEEKYPFARKKNPVDIKTVQK